MMDRSHLKKPNSFAVFSFCVSEIQNLNDHRECFHQKNRADEYEQNFLFDQNRRDSERPAERKRSRVTHDNLRGLTVEPEESERRSYHSGEEDGHFTRAWKIIYIEIVGDNRVTGGVSHDGERKSGDTNESGRKSVESVC